MPDNEEDKMNMEDINERYALLQAAATILAGGVYIVEGEPRNWESHSTAVSAAISLLEELKAKGY